MSEKRVNKIIVLAGNRGTGKTTYLIGDEKLKVDGLIDVYLDRDQKQKILVVDLFDSPVWRTVPKIDEDRLKRWKTGIYRMYHHNESILFDLINRYVYNTVTIFEDATKYINTKLPENLRRFLLDSKQKNNDVVFVFHHLTSVPPDLVRIADYLVLFKTGENFTNYLKNKYTHPEIERVFKEVQASKNQYINKSIALT